MSTFRIVLSGDSDDENARMVILAELTKVRRQMTRLGFTNIGQFVLPAGAKTKPAEVVEPSNGYPEHTGGGWYVLSDGTKVQGKQAAEDAEAAL